MGVMSHRWILSSLNKRVSILVVLPSAQGCVKGAEGFYLSRNKFLTLVPLSWHLLITFSLFSFHGL